MSATRKFLLSFIVVLAGVTLVRHGVRAMRPARPADMPERSTFVQSGYDVSHSVPRGEWIACTPEPTQSVVPCRITDETGMVEFEGSFLPLRAGNVPSDSELQLAPAAEANLWVPGPAENGSPVPVLPLASGDVLVPAADREALRSRWNDSPEELNRVLNR